MTSCASRPSNSRVPMSTAMPTMPAPNSTVATFCPSTRNNANQTVTKRSDS